MLGTEGFEALPAVFPRITSIALHGVDDPARLGIVQQTDRCDDAVDVEDGCIGKEGNDNDNGD